MRRLRTNSNGADSAAAETEQEQQQEPVVEQVEDVDMTLSFRYMKVMPRPKKHMKRG